jgi:hypothetical protein
MRIGLFIPYPQLARRQVRIRLAGGGNRIRTIGTALRKGLSAVAERGCRGRQVNGVIRLRSSRETTVVGRGPALHDRLSDGGTDGSNSSSSSGESPRTLGPSFRSVGIRRRQPMF